MLRILPFALVACLAAAAPARAGTARHERVKVTPIKKAGKTVGARFKLTIMPGSGSRGNTEKVAIALGRAQKHSPPKGISGYDVVNNKENGYLRHQFDWLSLKAGDLKPIPKTYELYYGKGNDFKAGQKVDVYSLWRTNSGGWHLWGSTHFYPSSADVLELPD